MESRVKKFLDSLDEITSSDVLLAILAKLPRQRIYRDMIFFQNVVFDLREKYPLLERFKFNTSAIHPYSEELERAIYRLEWAQALGAVNPSYTHYQLDEDQKEETLHKFSQNQIKEIEEISREFEERIGEYACLG